MGDTPAATPTGNSLKEWSGIDLLACILSAVSYFCILSGVTLLLLNLWTGYLLTALALVSAAAMFLVIDPKLRRVSSRYEKKQKEYLEELDRIIEWKTTEET
ncbi:MAG: hypothetical protein JXQ83_10595 [Candidatus Glassbacteria bacterium]|nr:hypothetical protein [Candidatus Glassbacteria bacterium]